MIGFLVNESSWLYTNPATDDRWILHYREIGVEDKVWVRMSAVFYLPEALQEPMVLRAQNGSLPKILGGEDNVSLIQAHVFDAAGIPEVYTYIEEQLLTEEDTVREARKVVTQKVLEKIHNLDILESFPEAARQAYVSFMEGGTEADFEEDSSHDDEDEE